MTTNSAYTTFTLTVILPSNAEYTETRVISELREFSEIAEFALQEDGSSDSQCSWRNREVELKEFSQIHPDVLFCLNVNCMGLTPLNEYYKGGKMQECIATIVYPPFDENLLK